MRYRKILLAAGLAFCAMQETQSYAFTKTSRLNFYAKRGNIAKVRELLEKGANPNRLSVKNNALMNAVKYSTAQDTAMVDTLLEFNANPNVVNRQGFSALTFAAVQNNTFVARKILAHKDMKRVLIDKQDNKGNTPLHHAIDLGNVEMTQLLLELGASPVIQNNKGETPLILTTRYGNTADLRTLVEANGSLANHSYAAQRIIRRSVRKNLIITENRTVLMEAAESVTAGPDILEYLLSKGASVDTKDTQGNTALMLAASTCQPYKVDMLITKGHANLNLLNAKGETAIQQAIQSSCVPAQQILRQAGAKDDNKT